MVQIIRDDLIFLIILLSLPIKWYILQGEELCLTISHLVQGFCFCPIPSIVPAKLCLINVFWLNKVLWRIQENASILTQVLLPRSPFPFITHHAHASCTFPSVFFSVRIILSSLFHGYVSTVAWFSLFHGETIKNRINSDSGFRSASWASKARTIIL